MKVEKNKTYYVTFVHYLDKDDIIRETVSVRGYFRFRNFMLDLGYELDSIELLKERYINE